MADRLLSAEPSSPMLLTRRGVLGLGLGAAAAVVLASCTPAPQWVKPTGAAVSGTEKARGGTGRVTTVDLTAAPTTLDLAGTAAATLAFGGVPAPVIRLAAGDTLRATLRNQLEADTSVHWHGLALRNDMDGVPPVTQVPVGPGGQFVYEFVTPHPGTYWFHPHVGPQLDHGLYGALIVDDPHEKVSWDDEWVLILDDWLDGVTATPDQVLTDLSAGMGNMGGMGDMFMRMGNMLMGATSDLLGGDAGDVYYPHYLINGKPPADPAQFTGTPGNVVRIRLINAGSDTAFRFAMGGHALTITHTDGFPVEPVEVDSILLGMGERYDVQVTLGDGVFPVVAEAEGKRDRAFALVRTGSGTAPMSDVEVSELDSRQVGTAQNLTAAAEVALSRTTPDRLIDLTLTGGMAAYDWGIDGRQFDMTDPLRDVHAISKGERVQLRIRNDTKMWHPFHLHGHTYQHEGGGPRKDTSTILPGRTLTVEFDADNPGLWIAHCHNIYHAESGMTTVFGYRS
ncbi:multicopper oxidase family protein [Microbacterium saccharophilum]|uniref:Multicopper oxidase with three cupredoxin domains (Includes cell division protein FtsP and spore coat protein CotA) n=1 Tax=Microbacterium saccharophilum TaxID=1213358 RepID=A0A7Z7CXG5_9MICO|nr:Multicopper oxidase with three cupredoxin domains (includes cell division protein FtsP and spore coat protein CotA) [Microbacterium saccharophilum]